MTEVINHEVAEKVVQGWAERFEIELDLTSRSRIASAVVAGRLALNEETEAFTVTFRKPVHLENGTIVESITVKEPTADQIKQASKGLVPDRDGMELVIKLLSAVSGVALGVVGRIGLKDLSLCEVVFAFFG